MPELPQDPTDRIWWVWDIYLRYVKEVRSTGDIQSVVQIMRNYAYICDICEKVCSMPLCLPRTLKYSVHR
jgi:hypothetical protein